jgi:hypothetical protein
LWNCVVRSLKYFNIFSDIYKRNILWDFFGKSFFLNFSRINHKKFQNDHAAYDENQSNRSNSLHVCMWLLINGSSLRFTSLDVSFSLMSSLYANFRNEMINFVKIRNDTANSSKRRMKFILTVYNFSDSRERVCWEFSRDASEVINFPHASWLSIGKIVCWMFIDRFLFLILLRYSFHL